MSAVGAWIDAAKFLHGPIRDGHCDGCHVAHDSERPSLLRGAYPADFYAPYRDSHYELCFGCHDLKLASEERTEEHTGFRDGNRNLHFLHVNSEKGRSCRACHEVHGSDRPFHIRRSVPFGDFDWELPIEFHATENGGTCTASCHQSASYDRRAAIGG